MEKKERFFQENVALSQKYEREVAMYLLYYPDEAFEIHKFVEPKHFHYSQYGKIYALALQAQTNQKDFFALVMKNFEFASSLIAESATMVIRNRQIGDVAKQIRQLWQVREMSNVFEDSVFEFNRDYTKFDATAANTHAKFMEVCNMREAERSSIKDVLEDYHKVQEENSKKIESGKSIIGISCGFPKLDKAIDGFRPEHMWTIMAYTSIGKSTFTLNMVADLIKNKYRVVFYSLEMSKVDIISRIIGIMTEMNGRKALKGTLTPEEFEKVEEAKKILEASNMSIHTDKTELEEIRLSMTEEMMRQKVDLFVVDYIQQVQVSGSQSIYEQMSSAASIFQITAKQLRVPLVIVSQISNETAKMKNPDVIGAKGAGEIAAKSDFVCWIVSDEDDKDKLAQKLRNGEPTMMKLRIMKNRHGDTGAVNLEFDRRTGVFVEDFKG